MIRLDHTTFENRIAELETLFKVAFGRPLPLGYLRWRFLDNPTGKLLNVVAEGDGRIVANYCASPCRLAVEGTVVESALSMTTMTHPAYRGQGLFTSLAKRLYTAMADAGYHSVWGFPNNNSHLGIVSKLNWRNIYEVPTLRVDVSGLKASGVIAARDDDFEGDYGFLQVRRQTIAVAKDAAWLKWRYASNPNNKYTNYVARQDGVIQAFAVVKDYQDSLDLVDLQASEVDAAKEVLAMVADEAIVRGSKRILTWMPLWSPLHAVLEKMGFSNEAPVTYFGGLLLQSQAADFYDFRNWYIQMGDSDVH